MAILPSTGTYATASVDTIKENLASTLRELKALESRGQLALNTPFATSMKTIQIIEKNLQAGHLVSPHVMKLIEIVELYCQEGLPNSIQLVKQYHEKANFSAEDLTKIESFPKLYQALAQPIDLLQKLSTPEGQMKLFLDSMKATLLNNK